MTFFANGPPVILQIARIWCAPSPRGPPHRRGLLPHGPEEAAWPPTPDEGRKQFGHIESAGERHLFVFCSYSVRMRSSCARGGWDGGVDPDARSHPFQLCHRSSRNTTTARWRASPSASAPTTHLGAQSVRGHERRPKCTLGRATCKAHETREGGLIIA